MLAPEHHPAITDRYCLWCQAPLNGSLTVHDPRCEVQKLIEGTFGLPATGSRKPNADQQEGDWSGDRDYEVDE